MPHHIAKHARADTFMLNCCWTCLYCILLLYACMQVKVFRHNDMAHLEKLLRWHIAEGQPRTHRPWKKVRHCRMRVQQQQLLREHQLHCWVSRLGVIGTTAAAAQLQLLPCHCLCLVLSTQLTGWFASAYL
jgi:hypothetical protein